jgi:hypothetical protein
MVDKKAYDVSSGKIRQYLRGADLPGRGLSAEREYGLVTVFKGV